MFLHYYSCIDLPQQDFCSAVLTTTHYAPSTLWINSNDLDDEMRQINELPELTMCKEFLSIFNCTIRYPACNANKTKVVPICESQCPLIDLLKAQCVLELNEYSDFLLVKELLSSFKCDDPRTYYNFHRNYIESNSTDCLILSKLWLANNS